MLSCASLIDVVLMFVGSVGSILNGISTSIVIVIFAKVANELMSYSIANQRESYYCGNNEDIFKYFVSDDAESLLQKEVLYYSYYYILVVVLNIMEAPGHILWTVATLRQTKRMRRALFGSMLYRKVEWFDLNSATEIPTKLSEDITVIEDGLGSNVALLLSLLGTIGSCLTVAMIYSWKLALIVCLSLLISTVVFIIGGKVSAPFVAKQQDSVSKAGSIAEEALSNIKTVVAFGGEDKEAGRYKHELEKGRKAEYVLGVIVGFASVPASGLSSIFVGIEFWYASILVANCNATVEDVVAVTVVFVYLTFKVVETIPCLMALGAAISTAHGIQALIEQGQPCDLTAESSGFIPLSLKGSIEFDDVVFSYPSRPNVDVLKGLSLTIKWGQTVAVVGHSGCGKSTIAQLLMRLYDYQDGTISIDGKELKDYKLQWLRSVIGSVSQEPVLFNTTIAENISYGKESATIDEIVMAAHLANAHDFITDLPNGYDTIVGEGGFQLSGGQRQRIAIARALIRDPKILLLDEATSALDTESERMVHGALDRAREGRTTIIIAHRLSTIEAADVIVSIDNGAVVEIGSHDDLMSNKGLYHELVLNQLTYEKAMKESKHTQLQRRLSGTPRLQIHIEGKPTTPLIYQFSTKGDLEKEISHYSSQMEVEKLTDTFYVLPCLDWCMILLGLILACIIGSMLIVYIFLLTVSIKFLDTPDRGMLLRDNQTNIVYYVAFGMVYGCLFFFIAVTFHMTGANIAARLRGQYFRAMLKQDIAWFDLPENAVGGLITRLALDVSDVYKTFTSYQTKLLVQAMMGVATAIVFSLYMSWALSLVIIVSYILFVSSGVISCLTRKIRAKIKALLEQAGNIASEAIENIHTIASLGLENRMERIYIAKLNKIMRYQLIEKIIFQLIYTALFAGIIILHGVAFNFGTYLFLHKGTPYGINNYETILLIMIPGLGLIDVFRINILNVPNLHKAYASLAKIANLINSQPELDSQKTHGAQPDSTEGILSLENVKFSYPSRVDVPVFTNLDLFIDAGQTVALVGQSGAGKSTAVVLIERFYDPSFGAILLDGIDLRELNIAWLRRQIGVVSQEPVLFDMSIRDNISYGANFRDVSEEEIVEVAKAANIHEFIKSLPEGYDTNVGLKGTQLSGGQKQRIAIARALIRDPKILLLDEATSALDTESERMVQEALDKAREGRTTIIIAHRLSTIYNADSIAVLHNGCIVEQGKHTELMAKKGLYYFYNTLSSHHTLQSV